MGWYSIDAVEGAFERTKKALIQPFDFWKWIKLGIIIFLLGGSGGGAPNFSGSSQQFGGDDFAGEPIGPQIEEIFDLIGRFIQEYMVFILIAVALILGVVLILSYISNVMEFVFVESLVSNMVRFWAYSGKYLGLGFRLFIIRLVLGLAALLIFIIAMLPIILPVLQSPEIVNLGLIIGGILWFIAVILVLAVIFGIIGSFINLSIPLAMYHQTGIIAAVKKVFINFKADWKQIIAYWVVRFILRIAAAIVVGIAALILFLIIFGILALIGILIYLALSGFGSLAWVVLIPYALVVFVLFIVFILLVSVPAPVFIKYHMLTFLHAWYPGAKIPFFDARESMPE